MARIEVWKTHALLAPIGAFGLSLFLSVSTYRPLHPSLEGGLFLAMADFANDGVPNKALRAIRLPLPASLDEERLAVALAEIERLRAELRLHCASTRSSTCCADVLTRACCAPISSPLTTTCC